MAGRVVVIDYGSGNLRSAEKALLRAARERGLDVRIEVSGTAESVWRADHLLLPGVGAFGDCMSGLRAIPGMVDAIREAARNRPLLGICVGMQLLADAGEEHGLHQGLGLIGGQVVRIAPDDPSLKIPHMGWNTFALTSGGRHHPVLAGIANGDHAYFVHSYRFEAAEPSDLLAHVDHGGAIAAAIGRDMTVGLQFHPEKSQAIGLHILGNFLEWRP